MLGLSKKTLMQHTVSSGKYTDPVDTITFDSGLLYRLKRLAHLQFTTYQYQLHWALYQYLTPHGYELPIPEKQEIKRGTSPPSKPITPITTWSPRLPETYRRAIKKFAADSAIRKADVYNEAIASYLKTFPNLERLPDRIVVHYV